MTDYYERLLLLKQSTLFSSVGIDDLRLVVKFLDKRQYFSGDRIFERDDTGDHLYLIVSGKIGISLDGKGNSSHFIATLGPGDCLGEMNLLDDQPRSATAHVLEDSEVLLLDKSRLRCLILSYPEISIGMLRSMSLRLREANRVAFEQEQPAK